MKRSITIRVHKILVRGIHQRQHNPALLSLRFLASRACQGPWSSLPPSEQAAWTALNYTKESWEGRSSPPPWKPWTELTSAEKSIAIHGLGLKESSAWDALAPAAAFEENSSSYSEIPPLSSLLADESTTESSALVAKETREIRQQQASKGGSTLARVALNTAKGLAPVLGPVIRSASRSTRGGLVLGLAGALLESIPTAIDATSGVLDVTGVDTIVYLDDSGSMQGSNLNQGKTALQSLEKRLKTEDESRFLPSRIVKFGNQPMVLNASDEEWNSFLVTLAWDGSSGGTYMWKMIEEDVKAKYRPAGGKLRVVVITDGADNLSPGKYSGVRGFDPLMSSLLRDGFDIEWYIIVVGNYDKFLQTRELSASDQKMYESLCRATGGKFVSVGADGWDEEDSSVSSFLDAVEDSGYADSEEARRERQQQYRIEARKGNAEDFDWLPALPDKDDSKS